MPVQFNFVHVSYRQSLGELRKAGGQRRVPNFCCSCWRMPKAMPSLRCSYTLYSRN